MSTHRTAELQVERWLRHQGLVPHRLEHRRFHDRKTPDFRVDDGKGRSFLVEVKGLTGTAVGPFALAAKIARARAQFDAINHGGHLANVLVLVTKQPARLAPLLDDRATAGVDLTIGLANDTPMRAVALHRRPNSRHGSYLEAVLPLGETP